MHHWPCARGTQNVPPGPIVPGLAPPTPHPSGTATPRAPPPFGDYAMATSEAAAHAWDIVVHPRYRHTLPVQGPAAPARRHVDFAVLPVGVLHDIAGRLATAQDLLRFEQVNKPCRCALWPCAPVPVDGLVFSSPSACHVGRTGALRVRVAIAHMSHAVLRAAHGPILCTQARGL